MSSCCSTPSEPERRQNFWLSPVIPALFSSSCCWLPVSGRSIFVITSDILNEISADFGRFSCLTNRGVIDHTFPERRIWNHYSAHYRLRLSSREHHSAIVEPHLLLFGNPSLYKDLASPERLWISLSLNQSIEARTSRRDDVASETTISPPPAALAVSKALRYIQATFQRGSSPSASLLYAACSSHAGKVLLGERST